MRRIYLISTDHLEEGLWFREEIDFIVAMNYIAIQAAQCPDVVILAFILMSNHVHFVLKGEREDVIAFINQFKHRYSLYYRRKYGIKEFLRGNNLDMREVSAYDEGVEKAIAYVQMNCVAANICSHPSQYRWGTGNVFFNPSLPSGRLIGDCSGRERSRILRSEYIDLPDKWLVGAEGYILPSSYTDVEFVESCFHTPKRMDYFLKTSSKARKRLESNENLPAFRDQIILAALPDLCRSLFQKSSVIELVKEELAELARQIRFRFSADATQIARVCGVSYSDAACLLETL